jgi:hypothetical protein
LEKDKKDMTTEMKISDAMEMLEGFGIRLHKMEEKMDLLISLFRSNNEVKIGSVKPRQRACLWMDHLLI